MKFTVQQSKSGKPALITEIFYKFSSAQTQTSMLAALDPATSILTDSLNQNIPKLGSSATGMSGVVLTSVSFDAVDAFTWKGSYTYNTDNDSGGANYAGKTAKIYPWDEPPTIKVQPVDIYEVCDTCYKEGDTKGNPTALIRLPNGRPFSTPPMINVGAKRITITWKSKNASDAACELCEFTVNAKPFETDGRTYPIKSCLIENVIYNWAYMADGTPYAEWELSVLYNCKGHNYKPVYMDYMAQMEDANSQYGYSLAKIQINSKTNKYGIFRDVNGNQDTKLAPYVTEPVLLSAQGFLLTEDATEIQAPVIGNFQTVFPQDWTILNIPAMKGKRK